MRIMLAILIMWTLMKSLILRKNSSNVEATHHVYRQDVMAGATMEMAAKDLAIGMAFKIPEPNLMVFVSSLRRHSPSCHILLFADNITTLSKRFQQIKKQFDVDVVVIDIAKLQPPAMRKYHPSTLRWILTDQYLKRHSNQYQKVLLADVRDTAFQSDPFQIISHPGFYTFREGIHFYEDGWNSGWVADCFGSSVAQKMSNNWVVCSGISLGSATAVASYTSLMAAEILKPHFEACERNGVDQGIHNVLVYSSVIQNLTLLGPTDGAVIHVQNTQPIMDSDLVVISERPVKIIHQYDRHMALQQSLLLKYVDWEISSHANGTGHCAGYALQTNADLFYGVGDIYNIPAAAPRMHDCCARCSSTPECCGFVYAPPGSCWLKRICIQASAVSTSIEVTSGWRV
jgi:hypothetical protein